MTDTALAENRWKPSPILAFVYGLALQPLAYLYVNRGLYCLFYLFFWAFLVIASFSFQSHPVIGDFINASIVIYVLAVIAASHAFYLAKTYGNKKRRWYANWWKVLGFALVYMVSIFSFRAFLYEPFTAPSSSMSPNIEPGDVVFVKKQGYGTYQAYNFDLFSSDMSQELFRGEVIVFRYPLEPEVAYVKRLIGLPGDRVVYKDKTLSIEPSCRYSDHACFASATTKRQFVTAMDGSGPHVLFDEYIGNAHYQIKLNQLSSEVLSEYFIQKGGDIGEWLVPEGHYFVLGDNRGNSLDSRYFGFVPEENLIGKVVHKM